VCRLVVHHARATSLGKLALHDLRRSFAKLCRKAGGELEQIQLLLGMSYLYLSTLEPSVVTSSEKVGGIASPPLMEQADVRFLSGLPDQFDSTAVSVVKVRASSQSHLLPCRDAALTLVGTLIKAFKSGVIHAGTLSQGQ
jgi:hypothetical protein